MENKKKGYLIALGCMTLLSAGLIMTANNGNSNFSTSRVAKAAAPTNTRRIWFIVDHNNDGNLSWWSKGNLVAHVWDDNSHSKDAKGATEALSGYINGLWYIDFTMTNATSALHVIVGQDTEGTGEINWGDNNQTQQVELPSFGTAADVIKLKNTRYQDSWQSNRWTRNAEVTTAGMSADELKYVLDLYDTCSDSNQDGYNAYPQLKKSILDACSSEVLSSETTLPYETYESNAVTIGDKIAGLKYWYDYNN